MNNRRVRMLFAHLLEMAGLCIALSIPGYGEDKRRVCLLLKMVSVLQKVASLSRLT